MTKVVKGILIAVVAVVILIAAGVAGLVGLAFYGHIQAEKAGNEAATEVNVRTISNAQFQYYTENGGFGTFEQLVKARILSQKFAGDKPIADGYVFDLKVTAAGAGQKPGFTVNADPVNASAGNKHYFMDERGTIHVNSDRPASSRDPAPVR